MKFLKTHLTLAVLLISITGTVLTTNFTNIVFSLENFVALCLVLLTYVSALIGRKVEIIVTAITLIIGILNFAIFIPYDIYGSIKLNFDGVRIGPNIQLYSSIVALFWLIREVDLTLFAIK